jgi:hypothetical protein
MNDTDAQTKGRSSDEVSPAATALKEAGAVMTNISEIHAREILDSLVRRTYVPRSHAGFLLKDPVRHVRRYVPEP